MSTLHIAHIRNDVLKYFGDIVDVSDLNTTDTGFEVNKLSRALSAYAILTLSETKPESIAKNIIDGSEDNGIDCFYFDAPKATMYFSQAKWDQDGKGTPAVGDVKKFTDGIRDLVNLKFDRFNLKLNSHRKEIEDILENPNVKYVAVLVHTGINNLAEPVQREFDDLLVEMNDASDIFSVEILNQSRLHSCISKKLGNEPINKTIELKNWGMIEEPKKAFYGQINGYVLVKLWNEHKENLFAKNIRNILGDSDANTEIKDTILSEPNLFWYYNNGITIIADTIQKSMEGGGTRDFGKFTCSNISIINDAQTVSTLGKTSLENMDKISNTYIQCRIIEAESISNELSDRITKTNNRQNRIENRDFVSQDIQQKRIKEELLPEGYIYIIQRAENSNKNEFSIDLQGATTALVCAYGDINLVVQLKREIGKLWENISKTPYTKIFNAGTNSIFLLHAVLIQREIDKSINKAVSITGISGYDKAIYNYGNRLIAAKIFSEIPKKLIESQSFTVQSFSHDFDARVRGIHENVKNYILTYYPNAILPPFFKNFNKIENVLKNIW